MRPGDGRECTLPASLAAATGVDYDLVMAASGAAFTTTIDAATWDPLAAAPLDGATLARAARAAGVTVDRVPPPYDGEMRELVYERAVEAIDAELAPLIRGAVGPAEFGLIVGYDDSGRTLALRTFFDKAPEPTRIPMEALAGGEKGEPYFLDRAARPARVAMAREAIALADEAAAAGDGALRAWLAGLRDEERWRDPKHGGTAAFADHVMRTILADKRRSAARFLRSVRDVFATRVGAELLRAAEAYSAVADAAERAGIGPFDPAVAIRFVEGGHRRAWANLLEGAIRHEAEAHEAMAMASAGAPA